MPYGKRQRRRLTEARTGSGRVVIQGRVDPALRDKANRAAGALDISLSLYLAELIARDQLDEHDRPTWRPALGGEDPTTTAHAGPLPCLDLSA
jgi:hypothetical protein